MPFGIGPGELIIVLIIALIVVGPGKLPDVGSALGKSIREFRKAATDVKEVTSLETPAQAPAVAAPAAAVAAAPVAAAPVAVEPAATAASVAAAPMAAVEPAAAAAPAAAVATAEPAGSWPEELTPADEQPTPSA